MSSPSRSLRSASRGARATPPVFPAAGPSDRAGGEGGWVVTSPAVSPCISSSRPFGAFSSPRPFDGYFFSLSRPFGALSLRPYGVSAAHHRSLLPSDLTRTRAAARRGASPAAARAAAATPAPAASPAAAPAARPADPAVGKVERDSTPAFLRPHRRTTPLSSAAGAAPATPVPAAAAPPEPLELARVSETTAALLKLVKEECAFRHLANAAAPAAEDGRHLLALWDRATSVAPSPSVAVALLRSALHRFPRHAALAARSAFVADDDERAMAALLDVDRLRRLRLDALSDTLSSPKALSGESVSDFAARVAAVAAEAAVHAARLAQDAPPPVSSRALFEGLPRAEREHFAAEAKASLLDAIAMATDPAVEAELQQRYTQRLQGTFIRAESLVGSLSLEAFVVLASAVASRRPLALARPSSSPSSSAMPAKAAAPATCPSSSSSPSSAPAAPVTAPAPAAAKKDRVCFSCKKPGHMARECPTRTVTCRFCRASGHSIEECPRPDCRASRHYRPPTDAPSVAPPTVAPRAALLAAAEKMSAEELDAAVSLARDKLTKRSAEQVSGRTCLSSLPLTTSSPAGGCDGLVSGGRSVVDGEDADAQGGSSLRGANSFVTPRASQESQHDVGVRLPASLSLPSPIETVCEYEATAAWVRREFGAEDAEATRALTEKASSPAPAESPRANVEDDVALVAASDADERPFIRAVLSAHDDLVPTLNASTPSAILVDSGAGLNLVSRVSLQRLGLLANAYELDAPLTLGGVGSSKACRMTHAISLSLTVAGVTTTAPVRSVTSSIGPLPFFVADSYLTGADAILGWPSLAKVQAKLNSDALVVGQLLVPWVVGSRRAQDSSAIDLSAVNANATALRAVVVTARTAVSAGNSSDDLCEFAASPCAAALCALLDAGRAERCILFSAARALAAVADTPSNVETTRVIDSLRLKKTAFRGLSDAQLDQRACELQAEWSAAANAALNTHVSASAAEINARPFADSNPDSLREVRRRQAVTFRDAVAEADSTLDEWAADLRNAAQNAEKKELEHVDNLLAPVVDFLHKIADGATPSSRPSLLGPETVELTADEAHELADLVARLATSVCDPSKVARNPVARRLPYRAVLEFKDGKEPRECREGLFRRYNVEHVREMVAQLQQMIRAGVVEPASENSRWAHGCVMAKKADGSLRFCIDYKPINSHTQVEQYQVPDCREICELLAADGGFYSRYDLKSAYWQVELDENSRQYTTFYVPQHGLWQFRVLAFGLASAVALFQRTMEHIFAPLLHKGVVVYLDDLIVYAKTKAELLALTRKVHAIFAAYDLRLAPSKCELFASEIPVLGHLVSRGQVRENPTHLQAVREYPRPSNIVELRRFLGMASWHRSSVPGFAHFAAPLFALERAAYEERGVEKGVSRPRDKTPLIWNDKALRAFDELRNALTAPPVTVVPDMNKTDGRFMLMSDGHGAHQNGSDRGGIGSLLYWRRDDGSWGLVQAHSRALTRGERKYTATQLELAALIDGARLAEKYIAHARNVLFVVDHHCLQFMYKLRERSAGILARWAFWLTSFDFKLCYRAGRDHVVPDALSRAVIDETTPVWHGRRWIEIHQNDPEQQLNDEPAAAPALSSLPDSDIRVQLDQLCNAGKRFDVLELDPPYRFHETTCNPPYATMTESELSALPVADVCEDNAIVFLWTPCAQLDVAMRLVHAWNLRYVTVGFVWDKVVPTTGRYTCPQTELVLIARRGSTKTLRAPGTRVKQIFREHKREHSRKPETFYNLVDQLLVPGLKRLSVFARAQRDGWTGIGDQADLFSATLHAAGTQRRRRAARSNNTPRKDALQSRVSEEEDRVISEGLRLPESSDFVEADRAVLRDGGVTAILSTLLDSSVFAAVRELVLSERRVSSKRIDDFFELEADAPARGAQRWLALDAEFLLASISLPELTAWAEKNCRTLLARKVPLVYRREDDITRWTDVAQFLSVENPADVFIGVPFLSVRETRRGGRLVVLADLPETLEFRTALLRRTHQSVGHLGMNKTLDAVRAAGWYLENAQSLLRKLIRECETCGSCKTCPPASWEPAIRVEHSLRPAGFNDRVHLDIIGPLRGREGAPVYICGMSDELVRWVEFVVMDNAEAVTIARAFIDAWVSRFGPPKSLATDQGANLTGEVIKQVRLLWSIGTVTTTAYHPQSNGIEERWHRTLKQLVTQIGHQDNSEPYQWAENLAMAGFLLRNTVHSALGDTPARLLFGEDVEVPESLAKAPEMSKLLNDGVLKLSARPSMDQRQLSKFGRELRDRQVGVLRRAERHLRSLTEMEETLDAPAPVSHTSRPRYQPGDLVRVWKGDQLGHDPLVLNARLNPWRWSELWRVVSVSPDNAFLDITLARDPLVFDRVSWMRVKPAHVDAALRQRIEALFEATMKDKTEATRGVDLARHTLTWAQEDASEGQLFEVEKVVNTRVTKGVREVQIKYKDYPALEWLPLSEFVITAPKLWSEWLERNGNASNSARRRR